MKTLAIFLLTFLLGKSCDQNQQQDLKNTIVQYEARTRGFSQVAVVQNQQIIIETELRGEKSKKTQKISNTDWKFLIAEFQKIKLNEIKDFEAPTNKSSTDAAAIAQLTITHNEIVYTSQSFDNGNPPSKIATFVNKIVALIKTSEKK